MFSFVYLLFEIAIRIVKTWVLNYMLFLIYLTCFSFGVMVKFYVDICTIN